MEITSKYFYSIVVVLTLVSRLSFADQDSLNQNDLLGFELAFDKACDMLVLDDGGSLIEPSKELEFPIHATKVESVEVYPVIKYQAGNDVFLDVGGHKISCPGLDGFEAKQRKGKKLFQKDELLPVFVKFKKEGNSFLSDRNRNILKTKKESPIESVLNIQSIDTILLVQYRGSHVMLIKIGGKVYAVPLPH